MIDPVVHLGAFRFTPLLNVSAHDRLLMLAVLTMAQFPQVLQNLSRGVHELEIQFRSPEQVRREVWSSADP